MAVSAVLPPGHAAGGHRAPRPLVIAARQQEAGPDASEVEVGKVTALLESVEIIIIRIIPVITYFRQSSLHSIAFFTSTSSTLVIRSKALGLQ